MPKVNVYLSDELAEAVRAAQIPVSSVCQRALEEALRSRTALHEGVGPRAELPEALDFPGTPSPRLVEVFRLAYAHAADRGHATVTPAHLVLAMLDEAENVGVHVLTALDYEPADLRAELEAALAGGVRRVKRPHADDSVREVMRLMREEAVRMGHNYLGCEHLLLGVVGEQAGNGGRVLRSMGVDLTVARRAVHTALSGQAQPRAKAAGDDRGLERALARVHERLEAIEEKLAAR